MTNPQYKITGVSASTDPRDYLITLDDLKDFDIDLPREHSLIRFDTEIENQGSINSCVANATCSTLELMCSQIQNIHDFSRLYVYYYLREKYQWLEGQDKGAYLSDGFKVVNKEGVCLEFLWPYEKEILNAEPNQRARENAQKYKCKEYAKLVHTLKYNKSRHIPFDFSEDLLELLKTLIVLGYPVSFAMMLYQPFYSVKGNNLKEAMYFRTKSDKYIGNHAMVAVGYNEDGVIVENSWGTNWGYNGRCVIPYSIFKDDVFEAWVCKKFLNEQLVIDFFPKKISKQKQSKNILKYIIVGIGIVILLGFLFSN